MNNKETAKRCESFCSFQPASETSAPSQHQEKSIDSYRLLYASSEENFDLALSDAFIPENHCPPYSSPSTKINSLENFHSCTFFGKYPLQVQVYTLRYNCFTFEIVFLPKGFYKLRTGSNSTTVHKDNIQIYT